MAFILKFDKHNGGKKHSSPSDIIWELEGWMSCLTNIEQPTTTLDEATQTLCLQSAIYYNILSYKNANMAIKRTLPV